MDRIQQMLSEQKSRLLGVTPEDLSSWLSHPCTEAILAQLQIDLAERQEQWALGTFDEKEQLQVQGQAFYIMDFNASIRSMLDGVRDDEA